ncbi:MAG: hydrogenase expression/formation protein HypE [Chromatiales bacterium]|nr:hydrogenase expression/formation protein HypE [Gammaproteobacteria bacterium]MBW6476165.1 hydrogenase expression/formation protein HypE [Chromatiales bacterium]
MTHISLAHGNGGRKMRQLIEDLFTPLLYESPGSNQLDAAPMVLPPGEALITTDAFTVKPLEFPGGDIGSLAVHGTVNDLAVSGATPLYLSLNVILEEGLEIALLERIVVSLARAAKACGVKVLAGDTKVVPRGEGSGIYLATTGIGIRQPGLQLGMGYCQPGDRLLVSGPLGDHGTAVMLAREEFGLRGDLQSDAASVLPLTQALLDLNGLRFMRDPTRGGLATVAHELAQASGTTIRLHASRIPVREPVHAVCQILGYDPYYLACEGRVVAVVSEAQAEQALQRWQALPNGEQAAIIGVIEVGQSIVILETELGGERVLPELEQEALPRIC